MKPRKRMMVLFLAPATLLYVGLFLVPAVWSFYYSVFDWSGFNTEMTFVGLQNFRELLFTDGVFWQSVFNTLKLLFVGGLLTFTAAFGLSIMLNSGIRGKRVFRGLIFVPNIVATIALTTLWAFAIYSPRTGIIPNGFELLGLDALAKFQWVSPTNVFNSMLIAISWVSIGYYVVLFVAAMDKIPAELYEAARLEGANQVQMFARITVPLIWDVITIAMVLWSISAIKVFEFPFAFMGAGEDPNLYTVGVYLFIMGFGKRAPIYRLGYAAAIGVVMLLVVILASIAVRRFMRRDVVQY